MAQRGVHAQQHAGPVAGLGAAGAGVDFHERVVAVGLAAQQRLQFGAAGPLLDGAELGAGFLEAGLVALLVGHFGIAQGVGEIAFEPLHRIDRGGQARAVAGDGLGFGGPVPERRVLDPGVQLIELSERRLPVKDAS